MIIISLVFKSKKTEGYTLSTLLFLAFEPIYIVRSTVSKGAQYEIKIRRKPQSLAVAQLKHK